MARSAGHPPPLLCARARPCILLRIGVFSRVGSGKGAAGFLPRSSLSRPLQGALRAEQGARGGCCEAGGVGNQLFLFSCNPYSNAI